MTVAEALREASTRLRAAGVAESRLDAELLLRHVLGWDAARLIASPLDTLSEAAGAAYMALVAQRAARRPLQHLTGRQSFWRHDFAVTPDVLIPRPETELLLEAAIEQIEARLARADGPILAWEVATGSGAVAVALARWFGPRIRAGRLRLVASDVSVDALALAAENVEAHGVGDVVGLLRADLLEPAGGEVPRPDVVVANLPYVASEEVDARHGSLGFEPRIALDGGPDGLAVLRRLLQSLPSRAEASAAVLLELGVGQVEAVRALAPPGASVSVVPDLAGLERVVRIGMAD